MQSKFAYATVQPTLQPLLTVVEIAAWFATQSPSADAPRSTGSETQRHSFGIN